MVTWRHSTLTLTELSFRAALPVATVTEMVELGIIEPVRREPDWHFDEQVVMVLTRASRLHRDLGIDWNGVALALELLNEVENLRAENASLRQQLARFL